MGNKKTTKGILIAQIIAWTIFVYEIIWFFRGSELAIIVAILAALVGYTLKKVQNLYENNH